MGVQIDGKRVANFAHLSDLDNRARLEVEEALPAGEIFDLQILHSLDPLVCTIYSSGYEGVLHPWQDIGLPGPG
eukprot:4836465-Pleurochrysis_carterae.AAC.1